MTTPQSFRSAFNGFNRDDVVKYISYITTRHENQVNQLRTELEELRREQAEQPVTSAAGDHELSALREQVSQLQAELQQRDDTIARLQAASPSVSTEELNAYRRAESAERRAMERVNQMYAKASGVLADAAVRTGENDALVNDLAQKVWNDLDALRDAVDKSRNVLSDTSAAIAAIRPEE